MKIIDEKGRLFGKLNLIDLLVIILLIAAVAAVAWKLVGKRPRRPSPTRAAPSPIPSPSKT